jgi:hypothetical protein
MATVFEIDLFEASEVPEVFFLDGNNYFLIEIEFINEQGLVERQPAKISFADLLNNVFGNNLYDFLKPDAQNKSQEQKKLLQMNKEIKNLENDLIQINNSLNFLLKNLNKFK